jgi:serine/threonine protein kinase HipA of HipAB toxin-antitoxin module
MTHNMLQCNVKKCTANNNYPLELQQPLEIEMRETEKNPEFILHLYHRIDWPALKYAVNQLKLENLTLPEEITEEILQENESLIDTLHKILLEVSLYFILGWNIQFYESQTR